MPSISDVHFRMQAADTKCFETSKYYGRGPASYGDTAAFSDRYLSPNGFPWLVHAKGTDITL